MFEILKFYIYPEIRGIVTLNGTPVEGAEVNLLYRCDSRQHSVKCKTAANGGFFFSQKNKYSLLGLLPIESQIYYKLTITYNHVTYKACEVLKLFKEEEPEFTKLLSSLQCELTKPETDYIIHSDSVHMNIISGIANWPN